ncbi:dTDP-4-dehydrorhamnose 3,5-epimerase [unidentified eubacterium SCB49]|nr:dTDP-4-dehydrorhamnose 3,5-epimerase [unidentified eubacterium SCB49]
MTLTQTPLKDCFVLQPNVFEDERGIFIETFNEKTFNEITGLKTAFVQDNQSRSTRGVLRGLHYQKGDFAQSKLVRVAKGRVLDIVVDLRKDSPTFGQHFSIILDDLTHQQLFVPRGFAHGFITLSETSVFAYKCDNLYHKEAEGGIIYNDATLQLDWHLPQEELIVSEKDKALPSFEKAMQE